MKKAYIIPTVELSNFFSGVLCQSPGLPDAPGGEGQDCAPARKLYV